MPLIQVLPNTAGSAPAPGWAYVADTGYDPSKAAINPSNRKRAVRITTGLSGNELTAKQQDVIRKKLEALEKDDYNPSITLPGKRSTATGKSTAAVKKILSSEKRITHHLDDEAAALAQQPPQSSTARTQASKITKASTLKRKHDSLARQSSTPASSAMPTPQPIDPLLQAPGMVKPLSEEEVEELLSAPPLPYAAARAGPPSGTGPPQRYFCETCGYWGRVKCLKCGARVCGLDCKESHVLARSCS